MVENNHQQSDSAAEQQSVALLLLDKQFHVQQPVRWRAPLQRIRPLHDAARSVAMINFDTSMPGLRGSGLWPGQ
ncbi:hypothetical protein DM813_19555 [Pseudomonas alkylphenolica]|uniref:Uncharacterized protein n=1 Tax=Pseudomonas alkylphenolica TaxID=237609 RepID=A0A443ZQL4_9PSED|nr:hypothetical protein DM813_19555 [Pseudomonas alkylphenolica]